MLTMGDEMGRTQRGNNNAYCQDNEISWVDWQLGRPQKELLEWTRALIALRQGHPAFRRRSFFSGERQRGKPLKDIGWFRPDGAEMVAEDWSAAKSAAIGLFLYGESLGSVDDTGAQVKDDSFLLLLSASPAPLAFRTPAASWGGSWRIVLDTSGTLDGKLFRASETIALEARALVLLVRDA